jgi:thiol-disulfide isomerase/thioredoxin
MHRRVHAEIELILDRWSAWGVGSALLAVVVLAGCAPAVRLEPIGFQQWQRQLHAMKGRVVVVDVWATWCVPCVERFPHMVSLYQRYKNRGVEFVSMSVDDREDKAAIERARQFLIRQKATFRNYLMNENIMQSFEKLGVQGIPDVMMYDRAGRLRYDLNGNDPNRQATLTDVEDRLARLAAEKS